MVLAACSSRLEMKQQGRGGLADVRPSKRAPSGDPSLARLELAGVASGRAEERAGGRGSPDGAARENELPDSQSPRTENLDFGLAGLTAASSYLREVDLP